MMKNEKKILSTLALIGLGFIAVGCGKANSAYTSSLITKSKTGAAAAATNTSPTPVQGFWESPCTSNTIVSWDFNGNGYFTTTDTYSSSDCSDDQPSNSTSESGTFQLGANPQAGYAQTVTFTANAVGGAQTETGSVFVLQTSTPSLYVTMTGATTVYLNYVGNY